MVWFGTQINVSTPDCFFPFCIEDSRRQGDFRLIIANEDPIVVPRRVTSVYHRLLLPILSISYLKLQNDRGRRSVSIQ